MRNRWYTATLVIIIFLLLFFVFLKPSYGWQLRAWLSPSTSGQGDAVGLAAENQALKAKIANLQIVDSQLPTKPSNYLRAMVFSRYPLNFKNELLLNAGQNDGVASGSAVVFQGILIGRIDAVFSDSALVRTIFDQNFKMPVRIGSGGYDGLLLGGSDPKIGSIAKTAHVASGDIVYSAAQGVAYALPIGEIVSTSTSADSLFQEAALRFVYDLNDIQTVLIAK